MKKGYIEQMKEMDTEKGLYIIGLCALILGLLFCLITTLFSIHPSTILGDKMGICPFYRMTGWLCPGCGGTRSFYFFLHGQFIKSFRFNAFVFYFMFCYVVFMISQTIRIFTKNRYHGIRFRLRYIYIGVIIAVIQFLIKNGQIHSWF
ncbi:MAG: DUF2752 domain-containing protein [bacterium]|nr:DUF2752 domain-containing protein [bacterium]